MLLGKNSAGGRGDSDFDAVALLASLAVFREWRGCCASRVCWSVRACLCHKKIVERIMCIQ